MPSADFYVGLGESAEWIGSVKHFGEPHSVLREILAYPTASTRYTEDTYREGVADYLRLQERSWSNVWPWPEKSSSLRQGYVYAFSMGSLYVFWTQITDGTPVTKLRSTHYVNGARNPTIFPSMVRGQPQK